MVPGIGVIERLGIPGRSVPGRVEIVCSVLALAPRGVVA